MDMAKYSLQRNERPLGKIQDYKIPQLLEKRFLIQETTSKNMNT